MRIIIKLLISIILPISEIAYADEPKVCFYEFKDFSGESFCSKEGEYHPVISSNIDNHIESISIPPGIVIELYDGINFSGNKKILDDDVNLKEIISLGLHEKIMSYRIQPAVCFYTEDAFQGDSTCLASARKIDLYHDNEKIIISGRQELPIHNDSITSIRIPDGMMSTIYENDNFNAPFLSLTESINASGLKILGMEKQITSIKASENKGLNCNQQCAILEEYKISLPESFGNFWEDKRLVNKQVLLVFNTRGKGEDDNYTISWLNGPQINMLERTISFSDYSMINKFTFDRIDNADKLSFIVQIKNNIVQFQYIQTLKDQLVNISPIISFDWLHTIDIDPKLTITNYNTNKPIILDKSILTADTGVHNWAKRDLTQTSQAICSFIPFLNIYNYIVQGTCQQLDGIVFSVDDYFNHNTKGKTLHIAGDSPPLKKQPPTEIKTKEYTDNRMTLTYIDNANNNQSLSLPAVAKTCMVSIYSLLNSRQTRQIRPHCIDWTLDIMTDFTLLFGNSLQTWNSEYFGRIIDSIIRTGSTGVAVADPEVEERLSQAVRKKMMDQSHENPLSYIKTAFDYAQLSYLTYKFYYLSDDMPSQVEPLPLGIYELLLETFIYRPTTPMVIQQGELIAQHDLNFEMEIITTPSPEEAAKLSDAELEYIRILRKKLSELIVQWGQEYQGPHSDPDASPEENLALSHLLHAGHVVTGIIHRRLIINRPGEIYVVVKFRGEIIGMILADRFNNKDEVELVASATRPDYVLSPNREGTVRGAGTAAANTLAQYLQQQGARILFSEVISQPSARVKQKVGFSFKTEL